MAARVTTTDTDHGYAALVRRIFELKRPRIEVGILSGKAEEAKKGHGGEGDDETTLLDVAIFNEFGTDTIPERSFLRAYFDENDDKLRSVARGLFHQVIKGQLSKAAALERLGLFAVGEIQRRIAAGVDPGNAESTIKQKGSSTPLVDTGQLRQGITHRAVEGG